MWVSSYPEYSLERWILWMDWCWVPMFLVSNSFCLWARALQRAWEKVTGIRTSQWDLLPALFEAVFGGDCDAWCSINVTKSSIMVISAPWWCNGDGDQHGFCKRIHEELQHWEKHSKFPNYWNTKRLMSSLGKRGLQRNLQQMLQHTQKITAFKSAPLTK